MTVKELKLQAKEMKIKGFSRMNKAELLEAINLVQHAQMMDKLEAEAFKASLLESTFAPIGEPKELPSEEKIEDPIAKCWECGKYSTASKMVTVDKKNNCGCKIKLWQLKHFDWEEAVVVFTVDSFGEIEYDLPQRSYRIYSNANYFDPSKIGNSLFGDCLDGKDSYVRLDWYIHDSWEIDYVYIEK